MEEHERRMLELVARGELFQACVDRAVGFGWRRFKRNSKGNAVVPPWYRSFGLKGYFGNPHPPQNLTKLLLELYSQRYQ